MKTRSILFLLPLVLMPLPAFAQGGPPSHGRHGDLAVAQNDDLSALDYFLTMSDAELDRLLAAIKKVRAMSLDERAEFRKKIIDYRSLPDNQRSLIRQGWGWVDPADREDWREMMLSKSDEERSTIQKQLQSLSPEERTKRRLEMLVEWRRNRPTAAP